jgi:hypothetical protein
MLIKKLSKILIVNGALIFPSMEIEVAKVPSSVPIPAYVVSSEEREWLFKLKQDVGSGRDDQLRDHLNNASKLGYQAVVRLLLQYAEGWRQESIGIAFMSACTSGQVETARLFVEVDQKYIDWALEWSAYHEQPESLKFLLSERIPSKSYIKSAFALSEGQKSPICMIR